MNLTLKAPMHRAWTVCEDRLIIDGKDLLFSDIKSVSLFSKGGRIGNGVIEIIPHEGKLEPFMVVYPPKQIEDGLKAFEYLDASCNEFRASKKSRDEIDKEIKALPSLDGFGTKKEIRELAFILEETESIKAMTSGITEGSTWLIVCTNKRVIMLDKGFVYGLKLIDIPLDRINSISHSKGLILGKISITDGATTRMIENISNTTVSFFADTVNKEVEIYKNSKNRPFETEKNTISGADEIMKYKELLDMGVLTSEEFEAKKKEILGL